MILLLSKVGTPLGVEHRSTLGDTDCDPNSLLSLSHVMLVRALKRSTELSFILLLPLGPSKEPGLGLGVSDVALSGLGRLGLKSFFSVEVDVDVDVRVP
jgi:hypothetical protein